MARTTIYFLPVRISSVTIPKFSEENEVAKISWEPVTTQPASSAITIPAHTSQGQQPISLTHSGFSCDRFRKKERNTNINLNLPLLPLQNWGRHYQWIEENAPSFHPQLLGQNFPPNERRSQFLRWLNQACDLVPTRCLKTHPTSSANVPKRHERKKLPISAWLSEGRVLGGDNGSLRGSKFNPGIRNEPWPLMPVYCTFVRYIMHIRPRQTNHLV